MAKKDASGGREPRNVPSKDIGPVMEGWEYEAGTINVRKITGLDGQPKLQMRLDLGLLQMEMNGRPDGVRPHGHESLLDYFEDQLKEHSTHSGSNDGFHLTPAQCQSLREESLMYYHRYLSLFVLGEFAGVARDTARNIRVLDLCGQFADDEQDRLVLEQYRPYIIMMNTRALASIQFENDHYRRALTIIRRGLADLKEFFARFGQEEVYARSNEVRILKRFARDIKRKLPIDPLQEMQKQLTKAIKDERYEEAARLRDEITRQTGASEPLA